MVRDDWRVVSAEPPSAARPERRNDVISTHLLRATARRAANKYEKLHPGVNAIVERAYHERAKWRVVVRE